MLSPPTADRSLICLSSPTSFGLVPCLLLLCLLYFGLDLIFTPLFALKCCSTSSTIAIAPCEWRLAFISPINRSGIGSRLHFTICVISRISVPLTRNDILLWSRSTRIVTMSPFYARGQGMRLTSWCVFRAGACALLAAAQARVHPFMLEPVVPRWAPSPCK